MNGRDLESSELFLKFLNDQICLAEPYELAEFVSFLEKSDIKHDFLKILFDSFEDHVVKKPGSFTKIYAILKAPILWMKIDYTSPRSLLFQFSRKLNLI